MVRTYNSYKELDRAHQDDISRFPMTFIFGRKSEEELTECLSKIGAKSLEECVSINCGGIIRKVDKDRWLGLCKLHREEKVLFFQDDNHLVDAFVCEMNNHEYAYTGEYDDVLEALGFEEKDLQVERIRKAFNKASKKVLGV